jgi:hypothetical protein
MGEGLDSPIWWRRELFAVEKKKSILGCLRGNLDLVDSRMKQPSQPKQSLELALEIHRRIREPC